MTPSDRPASISREEREPVAYLRDLDGTGSFHVCAKGDPGSFPAFAALSPDERLIEALTLWRKLVNESPGGVPRYTITPGAGLNVLVTMTDAILSTTKADQ